MEFHGPRTQILTEEIATDETVLVYTVPTGKKFYLIESMLVTDAGGTGCGKVELQDSLGAHIRHLNFADVRSNNQGVVLADHFEPGWPIELTVGQRICVISDDAVLAVQCDIFGYEVDA